MIIHRIAGAASFAAFALICSACCCFGPSSSSTGPVRTPEQSDPAQQATAEQKTDPKIPRANLAEIIQLDSFLGISPDFKVFATSQGFPGARGIKVVDLATRTNLVSPKWDRDWGPPQSAVFGDDFIAVAAWSESVKIFSRATGELEQNIHFQQIYKVGTTTDGRILAVNGFNSGRGHYFVLRSIQTKKTILEIPLTGENSFAVMGGRVAAFDSWNDQIIYANAESGAVIKELKLKTLRKRKALSSTRVPLAVAPIGDLFAFEAEDEVVLYDAAGDRVHQKLEGHLDTVRAIAFSPNGEIVASAANDKTIRFWNVRQGKELAILKDLPITTADLITSKRVPIDKGIELTFSADGKKIALENPAMRRAEIWNVLPK
jgi:WD40 repeat protein